MAKNKKVKKALDLITKDIQKKTGDKELNRHLKILGRTECPGCKAPSALQYRVSKTPDTDLAFDEVSCVNGCDINEAINAHFGQKGDAKVEFQAPAPTPPEAPNPPEDEPATDESTSEPEAPADAQPEPKPLI